MNLRQRFSNDLLETVADSEHALARDLGANREMISVALTLLHERGLELHRLREAYRRLRDEYRSLRARMLRDERRVA